MSDNESITKDRIDLDQVAWDLRTVEEAAAAVHKAQTVLKGTLPALRRLAAASYPMTQAALGEVEATLDERDDVYHEGALWNLDHQLTQIGLARTQEMESLGWRRQRMRALTERLGALEAGAGH